MNNRQKTGRFAPLDLPGNGAVRVLFDSYKIPAAFISERLHSATYGSGSKTCSDGFYCESLLLVLMPVGLARKVNLITSILVSLPLQEY